MPSERRVTATVIKTTRNPVMVADSRDGLKGYTFGCTLARLAYNWPDGGIDADPANHFDVTIGPKFKVAPGDQFVVLDSSLTTLDDQLVPTDWIGIARGAVAEPKDWYAEIEDPT